MGSIPLSFIYNSDLCTSFQSSLTQRPFLIKFCYTASDCLLHHTPMASMSPFFHQSVRAPDVVCQKKKGNPQKGWAAIGHAITRQTHKKSIKPCLQELCCHMDRCCEQSSTFHSVLWNIIHTAQHGLCIQQSIFIFCICNWKNVWSPARLTF